MRAAVLALSVALAGCSPIAMFVGLGAGAAAIAPGLAGGFAGTTGKGDGAGQMGYGYVRGDSDHDPKVAGGHAAYLSSTGYYGRSRFALYMHGRLELGSFGRDRMYGQDGGDLGLAIRIDQRLLFGVAAGYNYGGYPQNGHNVPTRVGVYYGTPGFAFDASVYAGWRWPTHEEWPDAASRFGLGWNTWGADGYVTFTSGSGQGLGAGISFDRQDDIDAMVFHVGMGFHGRGR